MKTVIEMALQAGIFHEYDSEGHWDGLTNEALVGKDWLSSKEHKLNRIAEILTPFAELARADAIADEREACAKVCDALDAMNWSEYGEYSSGYGDEIRKRGIQ